MIYKSYLIAGMQGGFALRYHTQQSLQYLLKKTHNSNKSITDWHEYIKAFS